MKGHRQGMGFGNQARETVEREGMWISLGFGPCARSRGEGSQTTRGLTYWQNKELL
jgi:hypothetical protein